MQILDAANYSFSGYSVPMLLAMAAILLLGMFVVAREGISWMSLSFFLITLVVGIWLFSTSIVYSSSNESTALWWSKVAYLGVPFIAPATYQFTLAVLRIRQRYGVRILEAWLISFLFAAAAIATDSLITGVRHYWWGYYGEYGWLGLAFILFFSGLLMASMAHYWTQYHLVRSAKHKRRIRSLMIAFGIGYIGSVDFVATYGVPLYPFGYLAILGFVAVATWAIWACRLTDITPAFAAEEIVATMSDGLLVLDQDGILQVANKAACEMFGYSKEALEGKRLAETIGAEQFTSQLGALLRVGKIQGYEMPYRRPQGDLLTLSISASVMTDRDGEPEAFILIVRDMTEQKRAEEEIQQLNESLEQRVTERTAQLNQANQELENEIIERKRAEEERARLLVLEQTARARAEEEVRAREVLLSIVSHDLRNLVAAVSATTKLLRRVTSANNTSGDAAHRSQSSHVETGLSRIEAASARMNNMINELLDFASLQAGQPLDLYRQRTDLLALARQVAANYQQNADRHKLYVETALSELVGLWDPTRLERVLDNLISNAIKYSPKGGDIHIEVGREEKEDGSWAVLVVRDQGVGIPAADLEHIFDWFHRAENVSHRIKGTGIGLTSVLQVVEQHGGRIDVESQESAGSTFTVRLPMAARNERLTAVVEESHVKRET